MTLDMFWDNYREAQLDFLQTTHLADNRYRYIRFFPPTYFSDHQVSAFVEL